MVDQRAQEVDARLPRGSASASHYRRAPASIATASGIPLSRQDLKGIVLEEFVAGLPHISLGQVPRRRRRRPSQPSHVRLVLLPRHSRPRILLLLLLLALSVGSNNEIHPQPLLQHTHHRLIILFILIILIMIIVPRREEDTEPSRERWERGGRDSAVARRRGQRGAAGGDLALDERLVGAEFLVKERRQEGRLVQDELPRGQVARGE